MTTNAIASTTTLARSAPARLPARLQALRCLDDFEQAARRHLPRPVFGYMAMAAETRRSLRGNRECFDDYGFVTRVLNDVSQRSSACTLFGQTYAAPFGIAPLGISALSAYRGDLVLARSAARANIPMIMSGSSLIRLEDVAKEKLGAWFQAYLPGDVPNITALIERVGNAGFGTLVLTVDTPVTPNPETFAQTGFTSPLRPSASLVWQGLSHPRWLFGTFLKTLARHGMPHFENNYARRGAPILSPSVTRDFADRGHLNWEHFALIRKIWPGRIIVKGILHRDDARIARELGADGIIVSNHGGRQLDGAVAPLRVLPGIVEACPDIPVMMDSGIRRGGDVLKALALGARFVFVGRPFGYAAAVGGEAGVGHAIDLLQQEVWRNMAMLGITALTELDAKTHLYPYR
ncbi:MULTISPECIES: alpha-hydroxy acid oxidase [unclassified Massilia]|uniref:alpha-hydroxy acid oxidase n=1 Tax=unclassified Massilia TaxID=2609279 RepID=UPI0017876288|nr:MULTISPECIES: alpha-hydroxy acid oxidase [unclassified Massilia]MBD8529778.1 alpha-hydroxy-acid oxidizing protein [Massilia sp. CFBP 13647]MBD8672210.1 alpha-hydroxy-acid oxidizing protein [Massilia sp. CFBP 13721]